VNLFSTLTAARNGPAPAWIRHGPAYVTANHIGGSSPWRDDDPPDDPSLPKTCGRILMKRFVPVPRHESPWLARAGAARGCVTG
jgi:hypothetical protein